MKTTKTSTVSQASTRRTTRRRLEWDLTKEVKFERKFDAVYFTLIGAGTLKYVLDGNVQAASEAHTDIDGTKTAFA